MNWHNLFRKSPYIPDVEPDRESDRKIKRLQIIFTVRFMFLGAERLAGIPKGFPSVSEYYRTA
jgi:hypothetical protein